MSLLDTFMDVNKSLFERGNKRIEDEVGPARDPEQATCCGNCKYNVTKPPHVCSVLDIPGPVPPMDAIIMNPYKKLKGCPYAGDI